LETLEDTFIHHLHSKMLKCAFRTIEISITPCKLVIILFHKDARFISVDKKKHMYTSWYTRESISFRFFAKANIQ